MCVHAIDTREKEFKCHVNKEEVYMQLVENEDDALGMHVWKK